MGACGSFVRVEIPYRVACEKPSRVEARWLLGSTAQPPSLAAPGGRSARTECGELSDWVRAHFGLGANGALTQSERCSDRV